MSATQLADAGGSHRQQWSARPRETFDGDVEDVTPLDPATYLGYAVPTTRELTCWFDG